MMDDSAVFPHECDTASLPLYRCASLIRFRLGASSELVYLPQRREAHVVASVHLQHLASCSRFRTLSAHAAFLTRTTSADESPEASALLSRLADLGLLISYDELLRPSRSVATTDPACPGISWVAIPTCGRPDQLVQTFRTYLDNARQFGHTPGFLIADDSPSAAARPVCDQTIRAEAADAGIRLCYAGREQRRQFAAALAEGGDIPAAVIRFALLGPGCGGETIGANRNAILLETLGSLVLSVDDDTLCQTATVPQTVPRGLKLGSHGDLGDVCFFTDRDSALRHVQPQAVDILAEHERLLGKSLSCVVREADEAGGCDLDDMCPHFVEALSSGHGHIAVTLNGLVGDSGAYNNMWVRVCNEEGTRRRLDSHESYRTALSSREIVRQVSVPTVSHVLPLLSTFFGFDNRTLLPPFFPAYRNDEGIFGSLLSRCFEHRYAGHLPWTLVHAPTERRAYPAANPMSSIRISDLILVCLSSWNGRLTGQTADQILRALGEHLVELGSQAQEDFDEMIQLLLWRRASDVMTAMGSQLRRASAEGRDYWTADLGMHMQALEQVLVRPEYIVPVDLLPSREPAEARRITRELVKHFGELLSWWPVIIERTRALSESNRRLSVQIL
jgi:hypothetical protein